MKNWYCKQNTTGQAIIADEDSGRTVAVAYDGTDGPLLAASPRLLDALRGLLECPALNEDETEPETRSAVAEAWGAIHDATQEG